MDTTWISDLCRTTFSTKGEIHSQGSHAHKEELAFHTTVASGTTNSPTNDGDDHFNEQSNDISAPVLDVTSTSSRSISYDVYTLYMKFEESTQPIFYTKPVPSTCLTSLPQRLQKSIYYVTSPMMTASETRFNYENICEIKARVICAEQLSLRSYSSNVVAFIIYCDRRRCAKVCDEGCVRALINQKSYMSNQSGHFRGPFAILRSLISQSNVTCPVIPLAGEYNAHGDPLFGYPCCRKSWQIHRHDRLLKRWDDTSKARHTENNNCGSKIFKYPAIHRGMVNYRTRPSLRITHTYIARRVPLAA